MLDPVSLTLFKASLNKALWASSLFSKKSIVSFTYLSSICLYKYSYTTFARCSDAILDSKSATKSPVTVTYFASHDSPDEFIRTGDKPVSTWVSISPPFTAS